MTSFIILAAVLTGVAASVVVAPLLRRRATSLAQARWTAVSVVTLLVVGAASLYMVLSDWSWQSAPAADSREATVAQLVRRVEREPQDLEGWLLLGRSYMALEQYPLALRAFERADRVAGGKSAEALIALAEALAMQDESALQGRAGELIERALVLEPRSPKGLFLGAAAALGRNDLPLARERFAGMLALAPPESIRGLLEQQIAALDREIGMQGEGSTAGTKPDAKSAPGPAVRVNVALSPKLDVQLPPSAPLFVFVRNPGEQGPPLAVKRLSARLPQTVELTAADAMIGGKAFAEGQQVEVVARIARSGTPTAQSGDPFGKVGYRVGRDGVVTVVIDRITP